ncbi:hypothetical protein LSAT2_024073 [Lamellibrachia satsuma]|nr:hypothetical protein LSAT2_024073 [Lamellibrachia satsuma]
MNTQPHLDLSKAGCPERVRMNPLGESRQEAQGRKSLLQLKSKIRIGCWNVRTLYQAGKLAQLAKEMRRYKLSIIGVCESRWNTFGKVTTSSGETYLYSGNEREEDAHTHGVGLLLSKDAAKSLIEWEPVSERIITARFTSKGRNITIIHCYAPTNSAEFEEKETFYQYLQTVTQKLPKRDIQVVMGDMNAKIGKDNDNWKGTMGKEGLGQMNENGLLFADFCTLNELIIGGTLFPHKPTHKATWISPDLKTENQIDHITITKKWRRVLLDVRVKRGADINSDHHLLVGEFRMKLAAKKKTDNKEYQERNKTVKKKTKRDKKTYVEKLANEAEIAARQNNSRELYKITRQLAGKNKSTSRPIRDKQGNLLTKESLQLQRWKEYFQDILNRPPPDSIPNIEETNEDLNINCGRISKEEIKRAIKKLKLGKAPGIDNIPSDVLKADIGATTNVLYSVLNEIWDKEEIPTEWKTGMLVTIPKKGNLSECFTGRVIFNGQVSEGFQIGTGVRQGCLISPLLFLIAIDWTMKRSTEHHRTGIQWNLFSQLEDLDFADDLALLSETHKHMQQKTERLQEKSSQLGLKINVGKTKVMKVNSRSSEPISLESGTVEEVQDFIYLGSNISTNGGADKDVELRINKARHAFRTLRPVWLSSQLSINTKIRIFNTNVKPVLLYGCETWKTTQSLNNKLQVFINSRLRYILKVWWPNKISNKELWKKTKQEEISTTIKRRKWSWIGHTLRKDPTNTTKQALDYNPQGKRRQGRPKINWRRSTLQDLEKVGVTWQEAKAIAQKRVSKVNVRLTLLQKNDGRRHQHKS